MASRKPKSKNSGKILTLKEGIVRLFGYIICNIKATIWVLLALFIAIIGVYNDRVNASEENTPKMHLGNIKINGDTYIIDIPLCNDRDKGFSSGQKYSGHNIILKVFGEDGKPLDLQLKYPESEVVGNTCLSVYGVIPKNLYGKITIKAICTYTGKGLFYECSKEELDTKTVTIPSIVGNNIILVDASAKNFKDADDEEYYDNIDPKKLKNILEKKGANVIITQAPGKSTEVRNGMVPNEHSRAIVFSENSIESQLYLDKVIIENIDELYNSPLHETITNLKNPEGGSEYALLLDLIGDCKKTSNCTSNLDFNSMSLESTIHLFSIDIVNNLRNPIVIILPTTNSRQKK